MSTMPGNPHANDARALNQQASSNLEFDDDKGAIATALLAQTQATLALAHEQRTANLMARRSELKVIGLDYMAANLAEMIDSRLGLDGDTP